MLGTASHKVLWEKVHEGARMFETEPHVLLDVLWKHLLGRRVSGWGEKVGARARLSSAPRVRAIQPTDQKSQETAAT